MTRLVFGVVILVTALAVWAQDSKTGANNPNRARVFVTDSKSWELSGGFGGANGDIGGSQGGGARPQTAEIIKTFGQRCPDVVINNKQERADYVVLLDHEGGKATFLRDNKVAVFNHDGDSILSNSTRSLGNAVKDACAAIVEDWRVHGRAIRAAQPAQPSAQSTPALVAAAADLNPRVSVTSNPVGADIEVDGSFVGTTPSIIELPPGDHIIAVVKKAFQRWERKIKVTGGTVNVSAELESSPE
jgi:hypothetical protein